MSKTLTSNSITFIDTTDNRKLDAYITSNLPTVQIFNTDTNTYSPNWGTTNLVLTASIYLDSKEVTNDSKTVITWFTKNEVGEEAQLSSGKSLTITSNNVLSNNTGIITYVCTARYQNVSARKEITFTRVKTGESGKDGKDGTSINILGSYDTIEALKVAHPTGKAGDTYLVDGDLYVWSTNNSNWINVGNIQGPEGKPGQNAKNIILSADAQVFKVDKNNIISPTKITVTAQTINTTATGWTYSTNGGLSFSNTVPNGVVKTNNQVVITGASLASNSLVIRVSDGNVSDTFTIYKAFDGTDGVKGNDGDPAPIAFLTNENITFGANEKGQVTSTTFNTNVVAYSGTTPVTPTVGTITGLPNGMTVASPTVSGNKVTLSFTIANNSTLGSALNNNGTISIPITSPINTNLELSWSKVNSGANGADGKSGSDAYTVVLTNESNTFAGDVANAIAGSTSTQVLAYKGSTPQPVTIVSVNGMNASTADTATGIAGLRFKCSALSDASPTITFTCTTDFKSANGSIPIVLSVDGITFTKIFTYSIAFKGGRGETGQTGTAASSYWLISSANVVQKTSTGTITVTPSILTFTGKRQTGAESPIDYACRWIIAYSNDGTNYTNLYTSTVDEISKSITVTTSYKTIRARMYMAGSTTTLIDEQIIPVVSDGIPGTSASLVTITPSALYFKSTTGKDGTFTPDYIYLYPRFQNATFSKWQYSIDGGINWENIPASSGVSVVTHNSVPSSLRISSTSILYTDTVTSISFRCNATNSAVYDVVSIAKIYDVVDLQFGGRNLLLKSKNPPTMNANNSTDYPIQTELITEGTRLFRRIKRTNITSYPTTMSLYNGIPLSAMTNDIRGKTVTMSFAARASHEVQFTMFASGYLPTVALKESISPITIGTEWKRFSFTATIPTDISDGIRFCPHTANAIQDLSTFYLDLCEWKFEFGNVATDYSPAPEDLVEEASNTTVMLSNEAHLFESDLNGTALPATIVLDVIGFKGATQATTRIGNITGIPTVGMTVSTSNNETTNTKITISVNNKLTSIIADYGTLTIPITVNGHTINKVFSWAKSNDNSGLQIGGRNLLKWTKSLPITTTRNGPDGISTYTGVDLLTPTQDGLKFTFNGTQSAGLSIPLAYDGCVKNNEIVTLSFDYRGNITNIGQLYFLQRTAPNVSLSLSSMVTLVANEVEWQHCEVTFSLPNANERINYQMLLFYNLTQYTSDNWIEIKAESFKLEKGHKATSWTPAVEEMGGTTFQLYAPKGYLLTNETPEITLQTFAYEGSRAINNATFVWYSWSGEAWVVINGATGASLTVDKTDVLKSTVYKCEMTYGGKIYEATATVEDKTDIYESLIRVIAKQSSDNRMYWVLYATVYSEDGEHDALLGPVSETAPESPTVGTYWYKIDTTNYTVVLMKYSGTTWVTTTDTQELLYDWFLFNDTADMVSLGTSNKVKIVTANDFSRVCSIQCNIFDSDYTLFARNSQVLNDPSDPIISETEPLNPIDRQLWIKIADNGTYVISIWDESTKEWLVSEADSQKKVYVEKPTKYAAGDIWIVGGDYQPIAYVSGVAQTSKHLVGTMLKAQFVSATYSDSDWVEALNYKERLDELEDQLNVYNQYFSFDNTGLTMGAKSSGGQISEFKTKLTNTELGFYQGEDKVAYINNNQLNISKAEISNGLAVVGTSPILSVGGFSLVVESNGSLSIITNN